MTVPGVMRLTCSSGVKESLLAHMLYVHNRRLSLLSETLGSRARSKYAGVISQQLMTMQFCMIVLKVDTTAYPHSWYGITSFVTWGRLDLWRVEKVHDGSRIR